MLPGRGQGTGTPSANVTPRAERSCSPSGLLRSSDQMFICIYLMSFVPFQPFQTGATQIISLRDIEILSVCLPVPHKAPPPNPPGCCLLIG